MFSLLIEVHFTLELSTWELELFTNLATPNGRLHQSQVDRLQQALGQNPKLLSWRSLRHVESSRSYFVGPKPMGFQALFSFCLELCFLQYRSSLDISLSAWPWICTCWNFILKLVKSKYQKLLGLQGKSSRVKGARNTLPLPLLNLYSSREIWRIVVKSPALRQTSTFVLIFSSSILLNFQ